MGKRRKIFNISQLPEEIVLENRAINTNNGITGGGDLSIDRTFGLTGQALSFHNLSTNGYIVRIGTDNIVTREIIAGDGITIINGDAVSGNTVISSTGVLSVETNCGTSPITNNTDIWAIIDVTSGPYTGTNGPQNITTLCNALGDWYSDYQLSNPEFTGNLYIGTTSSENYLSYMPRIKGDVSQSSFINNWYDTTGNVTSAPANWNTSNWVSPTDILLLAFVNEANSQYHGSTTVPTLSGEPTTTYNTDFTTFVDSLLTLNNFSGIIYPAINTASSVDRNFLIHAFAVLNNVETITSTNLVIPFGDNYTSAFDGFNETNPYKTNSVGLWDYNWFGVLNKGLDNGLLNFTSQDFANDLNSILSGNITQSVSLIHSYENQNLILRGLRSSDISFEVGENGCIDLQVSSLSGYTPTTRNITINGLTQDLSQDRTWNLSLNDISNVVLTSPASGQVLSYNGTNWVNSSIPGGGGGTVTEINTGVGLTGGPITTTGTISLTGQALSFHSVTGDGFVYRTSGLVGTRSLVASTGILISNGDGISGNPTITNTDRGSSQNIFKNIAVSGQSTIVADNNNDTLTFVAGSNVTITTNATSDSITISATDTNTTYSAGTGLSLAGTTFSHTDTSTLSGVYGSSGISSITVDGFGHITAVSTATYLTSLAHNHGIANSAGTQQFTFGVNENVRFAGSGATSISFDSGTKTVTISSTDTNTTYTAGTGLSLVGNQFSLTGLALSFHSLSTNGIIFKSGGFIGTRTLVASTGISITDADAQAGNPTISLNLGYTDGRYVTIETTQTITGAKTFANKILMNTDVDNSHSTILNSVQLYKASNGSVITMTSNTKTSTTVLLRSYAISGIQMELQEGGLNINGNIIQTARGYYMGTGTGINDQYINYSSNGSIIFNVESADTYTFNRGGSSIGTITGSGFYTPVGGFRSSDLSGSLPTSRFWKLGDARTASVSSGSVLVRVEINGTLYDLLAIPVL